MYKKSVSIILSLILLVLISGFSSNSFATGIGNEFQTISSVRVDSVENKAFFSKAKLLSEEEALQYTQLQDQAFRNSILDHDGGGSGRKVLSATLFLLVLAPIVVAIGFASS